MNSSKDNTTIMNMILSNNEELFQVASNKNSELFDSLWEKYWKKDAIIMRPSGNILTKDEWKDIVVHSTDVVVKFSNILSVDNIHFFADGKAAVANYTSHEKFTYSGIDNDDVTKVRLYNDLSFLYGQYNYHLQSSFCSVHTTHTQRCIVLEKQEDGKWLFIHGHVPVFVGIRPVVTPMNVPVHPVPTQPI
jgi:ketosteroid isomerase-like protein